MLSKFGILREGEPEGGGGAEELPSPPEKPKEEPWKRLYEEQRNRMEEMQRSIMAMQEQPRPEQSQPKLSQEELRDMFWNDPVKYADALAQRRAYEIAQHSMQPHMETLVDYAKKQAREANPELFDKYATDIEKKVKDHTEPQWHTNVHVWRNAASVVFGEKMKEIMDEKQQRSPDGPSLKSAGTKSPGEGKSVKLSQEEREVAKRMGLTEKQYARGKEAYDDQSKAWDNIITFSTRDKSRRQREQDSSKQVAS